MEEEKEGHFQLIVLKKPQTNTDLAILTRVNFW